MPPPKHQSQQTAHLDGQASAHSERPSPASAATGKGTTRKPWRRRSAGGRSKHAKDDGAGLERLASDRQATLRPGDQLPESRTAAPPETPMAFEERQYVWATWNDDSLRRNIRWQWHRTAQRWVTYAGPSALALVVFVLTRELGLPAQAAVKLSLACLASATGGYFLRELATSLTGRRRSRDQRSEADRSRGEDDPSS
jgi:hypothetical protein